MIVQAKKINFKYNFKIYLELLKQYKFLAILLLIFLIIKEATYNVDKFLFKHLIDSGTEFAATTILQNEFISILIFIMGIFFINVVARVITSWYQIHMINRLDGNMMLDLKKKFFNHIIHLSYDFHTTNKTGSLISRLIRGSNAIERMNDIMVFNLLPLIIQVIIVSSALAYFNPTSAIIAILTVIAFIAYAMFIQNKQKQHNINVNNAEDVEKANISDFFTNIDSIKYFGKENKIKSMYSKLGLETRRFAFIHWDFFKWLDAGQALILSLGTFFIMYFPVKEFLNHEISIGTLVFIFTTYGNLISPMYRFVHGIRGFYRSMADFESLFQYYRIENDIKESRNARKYIINTGKVEFKNINFKYHKRKIFSDFNLSIKKNEKIAIVGPSGSGKTSLIRLLYRLYDPANGEILIDEKNIKDFRQEQLRSEMSIVPQECVLFDDSIYNNIAFSNPKATRKEVFNAIKFAQLDKIITNFPEKEKTVVGERGVKLSGGEKQRVSIARAILANKKILILDEATSSLDSETEFEIQKDLKKLMQGRTSIIIAHRLSTIMNADRIIVIEKGKIAQMGTHDKLIKQKGRYNKLWELQKGGYL